MTDSSINNDPTLHVLRYWTIFSDGKLFLLCIHNPAWEGKILSGDGEKIVFVPPSMKYSHDMVRLESFSWKTFSFSSNQIEQKLIGSSFLEYLPERFTRKFTGFRLLLIVAWVIGRRGKRFCLPTKQVPCEFKCFPVSTLKYLKLGWRWKVDQSYTRINSDPIKRIVRDL